MKKYPRTFHVSFSAEKHSDDKIINKVDENEILEEDVVMSVKMDGGNWCIKTKIGLFARTHATETACPSFNYIKNEHYYAKLHYLNEDYWYFGENMYAIHSIEYTELNDYFYLFNIYDSKNKKWLSWEEVEKEAARCNFQTVPVVFKGKITAKELKELIKKNMENKFFGVNPEGFVIRVAGEIKESDFSKKVMKYVREGHVQTDEHWNKNWKKATLNSKKNSNSEIINPAC